MIEHASFMRAIEFFLKFIIVLRKFVVLSATFILRKVSLHRSHFLRGLLTGFIISVIVTILAWLGHFKPYENQLTDFLQYITYKKAKDVVLLFITGREYREGFNSTSPLSRKRLAETVETLVSLDARVIALDIDLSDSTFEDRYFEHALMLASKKGIPVVVLGKFSEVIQSYLPMDEEFVDRPYSNEQSNLTEEGIVLFEEISPGEKWSDKIMFGGAYFRADGDGVFRRANALYMTKNANSTGSKLYHAVPSFPVAVTAAYVGMSQEHLSQALQNFSAGNITLTNQKKGKAHDIHIHIDKGGGVVPNFLGNYTNFDRETNLTEFLNTYGSGSAGGQTIFKDKIVIVGGSFDNKDFYYTPVGRMSGMEILANITQNIISGHLITHTHYWKAFGFEVILGAIVALAFILTSRLWATIICFVSLVPLVVGASLLAFAASYYWFDFVPTIAGVLIHGWVSKVEAKLSERHRISVAK